MKITKLSFIALLTVLSMYAMPMLAMQKQSNNYKMSSAALAWFQKEIERIIQKRQNTLYPNASETNLDDRYITKLEETKVELHRQMKTNKAEQEKLVKE